MPTTTLRPNATTSTTLGANPHVVLSDESDGTYAEGQVSESEPTKNASGGLPNLPDGAGIVTAVDVRLRGTSPDGGAVNIGGGLNGTAHVNVAATTSVVESNAAAGGFTLASQVNAATWYAQVTWNAGLSGPIGRIMELWFVVTWNPVISGFKAFIFSALPGVLGAGLTLADMPRLARALEARTRTRLGPDEYLAALRELREHRHPRHFARA